MSVHFDTVHQYIWICGIVFSNPTEYKEYKTIFGIICVSIMKSVLLFTTEATYTRCCDFGNNNHTHERFSFPDYSSCIIFNVLVNSRIELTGHVNTLFAELLKCIVAYLLRPKTVSIVMINKTEAIIFLLLENVKDMSIYFAIIAHIVTR